MKRALVWVLFLVCLSGSRAGAQSSTFAGDAQHTAQFSVRPLHLNHVRWSAALGSSDAHYGAPLVTASNTVLFTTVNSNYTTYTLQAYEGATGRFKYSLTNDFRSLGLSGGSKGTTYGPVLTAGPSGTRLYYPGVAGTVFYIENPDADVPGAPTRLCFFEPLSVFATNASGFVNRIYITTPLTADTNGTIFFGFWNSGAAPAPFSTVSSGFARIAQDGTGSYVLTTNAAGNTNVTGIVPNCAPALSNDGSTLYVVAASPSYLLGLDTTTLATKYKVQLRDPRNPNDIASPAYSSTASPTVGPDGDVYYGVTASTSSFMGYMLHFSGDLATQKLPSLWGWDFTAAIVPTNIVKGYRGPSSYLLFSKYNITTYRNAVLDPNAAQLNQGVEFMREVLTVAAPFPPTEWCLSTPAVCASAASVFSPNADGRVYRWDLSANCLVEAISLHPLFFEPYVPTVQGPDGAVYTISGNRLYAIGNLTNLSVTASSSNPDERRAVIGQPITFTAVVTNPAAIAPAPTGSINFLDGTNVIATNIPLVSGVASTTTSNLSAGAHFINVIYSGDTSYPTGAVTLIQRIHAKASTLILTSSIPVVGGNQVILTATVSSPTGGGIPTGMVTFWDQNTCLAQVSLASGKASFFTTNFTPGIHAIEAEYDSDATFAASTGPVLATPATLSSAVIAPDGLLQFAFTNSTGASFSVLATTDLSLPLSSWQVLGKAVEIARGSFQFTDPLAATINEQHFYAVRSP